MTDTVIAFIVGGIAGGWIGGYIGFKSSVFIIATRSSKHTFRSLMRRYTKD